ncbi:hypothetical protein CAPTEDRAFT_217945 [Capitella teleta]|uniref:Uncharacterized protein n=1 Tax=Capitella teleta TaxID=283909 RepID=R7UWX8_CAPTE|nr:hypothetical protein CAPTEDRAFT_217945 [Capitella teleta]|eukprot:ELU08427.1 hypothetical protein CAPTEDRAFT_217945 [Capitella teleta]
METNGAVRAEAGNYGTAREEEGSLLDTVHKLAAKPRNQQKQQRRWNQSKATTAYTPTHTPDPCTRCGKADYGSRDSRCSALERECRICGRGHYAKQCRSKVNKLPKHGRQNQLMQHETQGASMEDFGMLGTLSSPSNSCLWDDRDSQAHRQAVHEYHNIVNACIRAAEATIPHTKRRGRAGWKRHAEPQKKNAILRNRIWKESGSLNTGIIHSIRKTTRAEYRRASRWVVRNEEKLKADKMTDTLHSRDFWTEIQRMQRKHTSTTTEMDGERGEDAIRELFAGKYEELYNNVPYDREEMGDILTTLNSRVNEQCKQGKCYDDHKVSVGDVHKAIRSLKHSKSDANNLLSSNHFKNACNAAVPFFCADDHADFCTHSNT